MPAVAFFDLDKTLLKVETGMSWMKYEYRRGELSKRGMAKAVYWSLLYKAAVLNLESLAKRLALDMAGKAEADYAVAAADWYKRDVAGAISPRAMAALNKHRERGDLICIATGATQYSAEPVARDLAIPHALSTQLEVVDGKFTGRIKTMCFGEHKMTAAQKFCETHGLALRQATFYSDSYHDLPLLSAVAHPVVVNPDPRLRRHAQKKQWPIEAWV